MPVLPKPDPHPLRKKNTEMWIFQLGGRCVLVKVSAELCLYLLEKRFLYFCVQRNEIQERGGEWFNFLA